MQVGAPDNLSLPHQSLGRLFFDEIKKKSSDRAILLDNTTSEEITYNHFLRVCSKLAIALKQLGVKKKDVITIVSENNWKYLASVISCFFIGATVNLLNHDYTSGELKHFLKITRPVLIFCDCKTEPILLQLQEEDFFPQNTINYGHSSTGRLSFCDLIDRIAEEMVEPVDLDPKEDVALILTSSGTTGLPKCVMLTHANFRVTMIYAHDPECLDINEKETTLGYLPFFHIFGCALSFASILYGTKYIILSKFKPDKFLKVIEDHRVTKLFAVPPIIQFLAKSPVVDKVNLSSVKDVICGGAFVTKELLEMVQKRLHVKSVRQIYGMTEVSGAATIVPKTVPNHATVGKVTMTYSVKVCDPDTGKILPPHQNGELRIQGPGVMKGYFGNDTETTNAFDEEGFLRSGDLGYCDQDGFFYIVDRLKEIIKYKGFQVSPAELENLLIQHPSVKDAGVVGVPDERAGEVPVAFVVKSSDNDVSEEELVGFIQEHVSVQKRLYGGVRFVQEIPKSASGKILRRELKKMV